jgi:hypothetical protein
MKKFTLTLTTLLLSGFVALLNAQENKPGVPVNITNVNVETPLQTLSRSTAKEMNPLPRLKPRVSGLLACSDCVS